MLKEKLEFLNKKVDEIALRTRLEIEGEHLKRIKCNKTLRFYTTINENYLKINTRVLNELYNEEKASLWSLVKRICISCNTDFISEAQEYEDSCKKNNNQTITDTTIENEINPLSSSNTEVTNDENTNNSFFFEWNERSKTDGFLIPIKKEYKNIQILVKLKNEREICKFSKNLRNLTGKFSDTKNNVIKELYRYINHYKLINYNTSEIKCNEELENLFKLKTFNFNDISLLLENHLFPIGYCVINLDLSKNQIFDINMEVDDLSQFPVLYPENIYLLERKIEDNRALKLNIQERIAVIENFVEDPSLFIGRKITLDSDGIGTKTAFYDDLSVQTALFELIKRQE